MRQVLFASEKQKIMLKKIKKKGWYARFDKDYLTTRRLPLLFERIMYITKQASVWS